MSVDVNWSVDKYKDDHENEDHWELKKAFLERWKHEYPEERLVCLAQVFTNMEFMGCRYPVQVMQEVTKLSAEVVKSYRKSKVNKLQRTFVLASTAAEDRVKGIKREGGIICDPTPQKSKKINFIPQGQNSVLSEEIETVNGSKKNETEILNKTKSSEIETNDYLQEMSTINCTDVTRFNESMFETSFGRMVLLIRPWTDKLSNIKASCSACNIDTASHYTNNCYTLSINGIVLAKTFGYCKAEARKKAEPIVWDRLKKEIVSVLIKEQWIAQGEHVTLNDISGGRESEIFGTPVANSVATKMMQMMGWKGGGLGADAQGIEEPIKPNLRMVSRAGFGSDASDVTHLRRAALKMMRLYMESDTFDLDLVFSSDFSKEERVVLHQSAQRLGLSSKSYGADKDRFLVVKKKLDPFSLVRAVVQKGGVTPKYQVFIPEGLDSERK